MICGSMARSFGSRIRVGRLSMIAGDIRERLGGKNDRGIFLAQRLQPLTQLAGKFLIIKRKPAFIDDEQSWSTIEPYFNAVEQIGQDSRRDRSADQPVGLKDLD